MRKNFYFSTLGSIIFLDFVISDIAKLAIIIAFWHKKRRKRMRNASSCMLDIEWLREQGTPYTRSLRASHQPGAKVRTFLRICKKIRNYFPKSDHSRVFSTLHSSKNATTVAFEKGIYLLFPFRKHLLAQPLRLIGHVIPG